MGFIVERKSHELMYLPNILTGTTGSRVTIKFAINLICYLMTILAVELVKFSGLLRTHFKGLNQYSYEC